MNYNNNALVKPNDSVFKKPVPPIRKAKTRRKPRILEEDAYLEEMGKIIQRDFFPDLEKVKAQNEYLDAVAKNDFVKVREIYTKYNKTASMTNERLYSPATFDTPVDDRPREDDGQGSEANITDNRSSSDQEATSKKLSLDQYLANTTSEDNQSFDDLLVESELRHRRKFGWLYKEDSDKNEESRERRLALPGVEEQAQITQRPLNLDTWDYKDKNYVMYVPDGVTLTPEELVERAKCKQEISYGNTCFRSKPFDESENKERIQDLAIIQARTLDGKIGVDGKEVVSDVPKINGYGFVKTPSPAPGIDDTPLMTWGEIEGTPFRLDGSDTPKRATPGPSYFMPEPPTREKIAQQLSDRVSGQHRDKKKKAMEAARRQFTSSPMLHRPGSLDRLQMLSPAARKMSSSITRLSSDKKLTSFYSPSPARKESASPSSSIGVKTPRATPHNSTPQHTVTTDNLLNITVKRRPTAADFFK
uniref:Protein DGCR14 n=1 Tax=Lygus hesperus TaxID=30085 RepID=A0A0A9YSI1_LYGHE